MHQSFSEKCVGNVCFCLSSRAYVYFWNTARARIGDVLFDVMVLKEASIELLANTFGTFCTFRMKFTNRNDCRRTQIYCNRYHEM